MHIVNKLTLEKEALPERLRAIASPPKRLYVAGAALGELLQQPCVAIVGSRKVSAYGREVTSKLAGDLARAGIVTISGLALGVDAIAHQVTLEAGGRTIAVLPSPLEAVYPASHRRLAQRIIEQGGCLISEYEPGTPTYRQNFIARNRLVAGLSNVLLITEAAEKSGTLHTARFALEQGRDVAAVPGSIFSPTSMGTNNLMKAGATPVTGYQDVLHLLGIEQATAPRTLLGRTPTEQLLLDLLSKGMRDGDALLATSQLEVSEFNQTLTMLELTGSIRALGGGQWSLA